MFGLIIMILAMMTINDDDDDGTTCFVSEIATVTNFCFRGFQMNCDVDDNDDNDEADDGDNEVED